MADWEDASMSTNTPSSEDHSRTTIIHQTHQNKVYNCEFTWTIPHFKTYNDTTLYSKPFSPDNHNYEWELCLWVPPDRGARDFIQLQLHATNNSVEQFGHTMGDVQVGLFSVQQEKLHIQNHNYNTSTRTAKRKMWDHPVVGVNLISREDLLAKTTELLSSRDALSIFFHISFVILGDDSSEQSGDFETYFNDQESSDLTINVDGKICPGHKFVLAAHSPVFEAMFAHDTKENQQSRIDIKDVDEKVFAEMLRFMYMGYVQNLQAIALDLAIAADKYNIEKLKSLCEWKIGASVTAETAVKVLISSELYNLRKAKETIIRYISQNTKEVMKSGGLNDLVTTHPKLLIDIIEVLHKINANLHADLDEAYRHMPPAEY